MLYWVSDRGHTPQMRLSEAAGKCRSIHDCYRSRTLCRSPTIHGQGSGVASVLGGWEFGISSTSKNADLAWEFIKIAQAKDHMTYMANHGGMLPPSTVVANGPGFLNFAPPFQKIFGDLLAKSVSQPQDADFQVWGAGFNQATTTLIQNPATTVDEVINQMKAYVGGQLGPDKVEAR